MEDFPEPFKFTAYDIHKSFGVLILGLFFVRLYVKLTSAPVALPESIAALQQKVAKLTHIVFYVFMITMPVSGYLMSNGKGYGVAFFGIDLPKVTEKNDFIYEIAHEVHEIVGIIFAVLLALHILAVVIHKKAHKVNLLERMSFKSKE